MRRLIVTAHWSSAGRPDDVEAACEVMAPLKDSDTVGWAGAFEGDDAIDLYNSFIENTDAEVEISEDLIVP